MASNKNNLKTKSKLQKHLTDCIVGINASNGASSVLEASDFIRGSINDLTKALEYLGFNEEATNIRKEIKVGGK